MYTSNILMYGNDVVALNVKREIIMSRVKINYYLLIKD